MTKKEVANILTVIESIYPNFRVSDVTATVSAWNWALHDYTYEDVGEALKIYIKTNNTGFAPSVSQLIGLMHKEDELSYPTEAEAWEMVRKACGRLDWYLPEKEFHRLPEIVRMAVVSPSNLKEWAMLDIDEFETVISSNFQRTYRAIVERSKEIKNMPEEIRERIEKAREKMLIEGGLNGGVNDRKQLVDSSGEIPKTV